MARFHGIWPAMPSPLTDDFEIDREGAHRVVNWLIDNGIHGISALGSTGECAGLSKRQRRDLLVATIEAADGRIPVMGGANGTHFEDILEDLEMCADVGAVGALVPPPFYYPLITSAVVDYFTQLADRSPAPIFLYHIPRMTKVPIEVEAVEELARHPNIVGLKDSNRDLVYFEEVARIASEVDDFSAFTGGDNLLYPALCVGGHGIIGATVNVVPDVERALYDAYQAGDHARANELQREINRKGVVARMGNFPAGFKATLAARGLCNPTMTRPIPALSDAEMSALKDEMSALGMLETAPAPAD